MRNLKSKLKLKEINYKKIIDYGFKKINDNYIYKKYISDNKFYVEVIYRNNSLISKVVEVDGNYEYILVDINSVNGDFVSKIKIEYESIIDDIINNCFDDDIFKQKQTKKVINYINKKYKTKLEFLWNDYPDCAIARNPNGKWYLLVMTISKRKLGLDSDDMIEIIDIKHPIDRIEKIVDNVNIFKGYHMNKKHWITIILDNKIEDKLLFKLIDTSYILTFD